MSTATSSLTSSTTQPNLHGLTRTQYDTLISKAIAAKSLAYCPYSHFPVGCTLLTSPPQSTYIPGANLENASYPVSLCAERAALANALIEGHRSFLALAVATNSVAPEGGDSLPSPCGMCRQFIGEFLEAGTPVFMVDGEGKVVVKTVGELLPWGFGKGMLESGTGPGKRAEKGGDATGQNVDH